MKLFRITAVLLLTALLTGCVRYDLDEVLLSRSEVSLTWKGKAQIIYDPATWQMSYNSEKNEFRVNDDEMANYFVFRSKTRPSYEGQELNAYVEWTLKTNVKRYEGVRFEVKQVDDGGCIWLWSKSQKIGITVKELN